MSVGFFDNFKSLGGGGRYMSAEEKQFLIENGVSFEVRDLAMDADNAYGPRYVAFCLVPNEDTGEPEEKKISFPVGSGVDTRDAMLKQMEEYLDGDEVEPVFIKLEKAGRAIMIPPGEAPVTATAATSAR